jgi:hypothetical protein
MNLNIFIIIIIKMSHIKIEEIDYKLLKIAKSGRTVCLRYNNDPFQISTCKLYTPFGVNGYANNYSPYTDWSISCSVSQLNNSFQNEFDKLDNNLIELIKDSDHLFKDIDFENNNFYNPTFKQNKSFPKLMKLAIPRDKNGNILTVFFDENATKIPVDDKNIEQILSKRTIFKCIIESKKLWSFKGLIGSIWEILQIRIISRQTDIEPDEDVTVIDPSIYTKNLMLDD